MNNETFTRCCKNCKNYGSSREWVSSMTGEIVFKCDSKSVCYHWESPLCDTVLRLYSETVFDENTGTYEKKYQLK